MTKYWKDLFLEISEINREAQTRQNMSMQFSQPEIIVSAKKKVSLKWCILIPAKYAVIIWLAAHLI